MPKPNFPFVLVKSLFTEDPDLSYLRDLPTKAKKPQAPAEQDEAPDMATPAFAPGGKRKKFAQAHPDQPAPQAQFIPPTRQAFTHHETGQPTLAMKTLPDLPSGDARQQAHLERYNDPQAMADRVRHLGHSANPVFHSKQNNGHETIIKPTNSMHPSHDPQQVGPRNAAVYDFLSGVGAHHMGTPNFVGSFHQDEKLGKRHPRPDDSDSPEKQTTMARSHAGQPAHVIEYQHGTPLAHASQQDIDSVDDHHRLVGALAHTVFGNTDGGVNNVMLAKGPNGKTHPVIYDNDIAGESYATQARREKYGKDAVRSQFLPGGKLAYNQNGKQWGTNYPPEVQAQLHEYARGAHFGQHGMSPEDAELIQRNASDLLNHGLEKTIQNRHVMDPSHAREDAPTRVSDDKRP
jgi:hypothetical protein